MLSLLAACVASEPTGLSADELAAAELADDKIAPPQNAVRSPDRASDVPVDASDDSDPLPAPPPLVALSWTALARSSQALTPTDHIELQVQSLTAEPLLAELSYTVDDGAGDPHHISLGTLPLNPRDTQSLVIDLSTSGLALADLQYSGRLHVSLQLHHQDVRRPRTAHSPPLYFHPRSRGQLQIYDETALHTRFNAGDHRGAAPADDPLAPGVVIDRVTCGGAGTSTLPLRDGAVADSARYTICIEWQIETTDSCNDASCGIPHGPNAGGHEDYFADCNDPGCEVPARGVQVRLARDGWQQTFDADADGCFSFADSGGRYTMTVHGLATTREGSFVRIHDAPGDFSAAPGKTHALTLTDVTPTPGGANTYAVGGYDRKWTTMAILGHGLHIWRDGLAGKAIHAGLDPTNCHGASAHYHDCSGASCSSNAAITAGRHHLFIGTRQTPECPAPIATAKFAIGHELGHAIAALWYGDQPGATDGGEPAYDDSFNTTPNSCGASTTYSMGSKEYNNVGFREGFAHFLSARMWNARDPEAAFMWFEPDMHDMERWGFGKGAAPGGRITNECTGSRASAATNEDWMRFFWDWYTDTDAECAARPSGRDMLDLYAQLRLGGGLTAMNYFSRLRAAATTLALPTCLTTARFNAHAAANGLVQHSLH